MNLEKQILTFIFSLLFGLLFAIELKLNYRFIYQENKIYRITTTFLFVLINVFLYFILLQKINHGILHVYGILSIIIGVIIEHFVEKYLRGLFANKIKK